MSADADRPASIAPNMLTERSDFLRAAKARRQSMPGFLLQARRRAEAETAVGARVGYTCSKKIGNAVIRNRAKRRLRAIMREVAPGRAREGWDYVLVGRPADTIERPFHALRDDLERAFRQVHSEK